jgi:hypothetical protein
LLRIEHALGLGDGFEVGNEGDRVGFVHAGGLEGVAEVFDVGGVVLAEVDVHRHRVDVRLQGLGGVGQGGLREIQRLAAGRDDERSGEGGGAGGEEDAAVHGGSLGLKWSGGYEGGRDVDVTVKVMRAKLCRRGSIRRVMAAVTHPPEWTTPQSSFRSRDDWSLKWWVMFALILSVVFHMMLVVGFDFLGVSAMQPVKMREVPERIRISEQVLKEQQAIQQIPETIAPGNVPDMKAFEPKLDNFDKLQELPKNQEIDLTPNVKEITNFIRANDPGDGAPGSPKATTWRSCSRRKPWPRPTSPPRWPACGVTCCRSRCRKNKCCSMPERSIPAKAARWTAACSMR